jgi:hypothetical protein
MGHVNELVQLGFGNLDTGRHIGTNHAICYRFVILERGYCDERRGAKCL